MSTAVNALDYYLHETWEPDREFVDGMVLERNLGEKDHAKWQSALIDWLRKWRKSADISVLPELRLQTKPYRFRIPDVMVTDRSAPDEQIITHTPLLCVEILSPEDRIGRLEEKLTEYFEMGVRAVWVIDPRTSTAYQCTGPRFDAWKATEELIVPDTPIRIAVSDLRADLD